MVTGLRSNSTVYAEYVTNVLRYGIRNVQYQRESGTYTGHYDTGSLYNSIRARNPIALSSGSTTGVSGLGTGTFDFMSYELNFPVSMNSYGWELDEGGRGASGAPFSRILSWASRREPDPVEARRLASNTINYHATNGMRGTNWIQWGLDNGNLLFGFAAVADAVTANIDQFLGEYLKFDDNA